MQISAFFLKVNIRCGKSIGYLRFKYNLIKSSILIHVKYTNHKNLSPGLLKAVISAGIRLKPGKFSHIFFVVLPDYFNLSPFI